VFPPTVRFVRVYATRDEIEIVQTANSPEQPRHVFGTPLGRSFPRRVFVKASPYPPRGATWRLKTFERFYISRPGPIGLPGRGIHLRPSVFRGEMITEFTAVFTYKPSLALSIGFSIFSNVFT